MIPRCGLELCPWKQFKQIALSSINTQCVQEPLQSSLEEMIEELDEEMHPESVPHWAVLLFAVNMITITLIIACYLLYFHRFRGKPQHATRRLLDNSYDSLTETDVELVSNKV